MKYENPKITVTKFETESILTLSAGDINTEAVMSVMDKMQADTNNYHKIMILK